MSATQAPHTLSNSSAYCITAMQILRHVKMEVKPSDIVTLRAEWHCFSG